ncbi:hypothetical protein WOLCODRAFT_135537 [Wolfiporia cocos MD-104 SS10]|uniref:Uncharacterized protein n=1 Tax=Wolfiporia cocos (strain MD-104) TaxID=742152 RepID=A0A2H3J5Z2_WOLCO|nr:hypothetical protein WOLCODRAFT_135537 [Wolfiporia cocos MD-104 SS10]
MRSTTVIAVAATVIAPAMVSALPMPPKGVHSFGHEHGLSHHGQGAHSHHARGDASEAISLSTVWDAAKDAYKIGKDGYDAYEAGNDAYNNIKNNKREQQHGSHRQSRPHGEHRMSRKGQHPKHRGGKGHLHKAGQQTQVAAPAQTTSHVARDGSEAISLGGLWNAAKDAYTIGKDGYDAYEAGKSAYDSIKNNNRRDLEIAELLARADADSEAISLSGLWDTAKDVYTIGKDGYDAYEAGKSAYDSIKNNRRDLEMMELLARADASSEAISLGSLWNAAKDAYTIGKDGYDAYEAGKDAYNQIKSNKRDLEIAELLARAGADSEAISLSGLWDAAKGVYTIGKDGYDAYEAGKDAYDQIKNNKRDLEIAELLARTDAGSEAISLGSLWDAAKDAYTIGKDGYDAYEAGKDAYNNIKNSRSLADLD